MAELEQKWQNEVDDAMHGKLENNIPFFYDYHFNEVSIAAAVCAHALGCSFNTCSSLSFALIRAR